MTGFKFTCPNGNSIFLPAAGTRVANDVTALGTEGYYLTGTVNSSNTEFAVGYQFAASVNHRITAAVYQGMAVRAVSTAKNVDVYKRQVPHCLLPMISRNSSRCARKSGLSRME